MGNHDVGRGMATGARGFWIGNGDAEVSKEKALRAMDAIAEDYKGADAEFDDELSTDTPLSRLLVIAFTHTPEMVSVIVGDYDEEREEMSADDVWELWYDGPYAQFRDRYEF